MYPFLETIKIINGKAPYLAYHQKRLNRTFERFFSVEKSLDLSTILAKEKKIIATQDFENQVFKCRFLYDSQFFSIEILPYRIQAIDSLKIINVSDDFSYPFKFSNRTILNQLVIEKQEVLMVKNGFLTDTTYHNIALKMGQNWFTPENPLLKGTKRDYLLEKKIIQTRPVTVQDLYDSSEIKLFNAMIDWEEAPVINPINLL
jgi:4-amino-4-deoxychorismate lyase